MDKPIKTNKQRLEDWLHEVLRNETKGATLELEDGREAHVYLEDDCLHATTFEDGPDGEDVHHARIRLVSEDPSED